MSLNKTKPNKVKSFLQSSRGRRCLLIILGSLVSIMLIAFILIFTLSKEKTYNIIVNIDGVEDVVVYDGNAVKLKTPKKDFCVFDHWELENGTVFDINEFFKNPTNVKIKAVFREHDHKNFLTKVDKVEPTCETNGSKEYYVCSCGKYYKDIYAQNLIEDINSWKVIPAKHKAVFVNKVDATFESDGNIAYYKCSVCGKMFLDKQLTKPVVNITIPKYTLTHYPKVEPSVNKEGTKEYYKGSNGRYYADVDHKIDVTENFDIWKIQNRIPVEYVKEQPAQFGKTGVESYYKDANNNKYKKINNIYVLVTDEELKTEEDDGTVNLFVNKSSKSIQILHKKEEKINLYNYLSGVNNVDYFDFVLYKDSLYKEKLTTLEFDTYIKTKPEKDIYVLKNYKVTFNSNGGNCGLDFAIVTYGLKYQTLPIATKQKYVFDGWYLSGSNFKVMDNLVYNQQSNCTLVASFYSEGFSFSLQVNDKYKITSYLDNLSENIVVPNFYKNKVVTEIDNNVFSGTNIKSVYISSNIQKINSQTFNNCSNLTNIIVDKNNTFYKVENNCLIEILTNKVIVSFGKSSIPFGVEVIGSYAFANQNNPLNIIVPTSVKVIEPYAFYNSNLQSITFDKDLQNDKIGLTLIGDFAFLDCKQLNSFKMLNTTTTVGEGAFKNCINLKDVTLSKNLTQISKGLFENNQNLEVIEIPEGVLNINDFAFSGCVNLKNLIIPTSTQYIGQNVFNLCQKIVLVVYLKTQNEFDLIQKHTLWNNGMSTNFNFLVYANSSDITFDKTTGTITKYNGSDKCIIIPDQIESTDVKIVGNNAFVSSNIKLVILPAHLTTIGDEAFANSQSLTSVIMQDKVTSINQKAFYGCINLENIMFSNNITFVGENAFYNTKWNGNIKNQVIYIGKVLYKCNNNTLQNVYVNYGTTVINKDAFNNVSSLTEITISETVNQINDLAFNNCVNLQTVVLDSKHIALNYKESCNLIKYATKLYVKEDIMEISNIVLSNFTLSTDQSLQKDGYKLYVKNI